jgi:hypothetical protein
LLCRSLAGAQGLPPSRPAGPQGEAEERSLAGAQGLPASRPAGAQGLPASRPDGAQGLPAPQGLRIICATCCGLCAAATGVGAAAVAAIAAATVDRLPARSADFSRLVCIGFSLSIGA